MKVLVDIGHPVDVHFYKNMIWNLEEKGHEVMITARDKDVALRLLDAYGFEYKNLGKSRKGLINKLMGLVDFDYKIYKLAKNFKPDILTGFGSMYAAQVGKALGKPSIIFDDTEHSWEQHVLYTPFADAICTPTCFKKKFNLRKHVKFNGYKELAYLHPNYFKPDSSVLDEMGLSKDDRFFILRIVSWEASHDRGHSGIHSHLELIKKLEEQGRVIITSEKPLTGHLKDNQKQIPPEKIHSLLYYADMYLGEGATMASEAAVLGTPSLYVNPLPLGYLTEQSEKYGLVQIFPDPKLGLIQALEKANELLEDKNLKVNRKNKQDNLLSDKIDVTEWMTDFIEDYPGSFEEYQRNMAV
jgi:predicted glycosyltransferase